jgi:hypothetical protein
MAVREVGPHRRFIMQDMNGIGAISAAPIIVMTYQHAGADLLAEMLSESPSLARTSATGLLPLCHEAIETWRQAEDVDGLPTSLAVKSVRALASTMITVIMARTDGRRWCETAYVSAPVVRTFLQIFPGTTIVCLHRNLQGLFSEAAHAYPWGLGQTPFWGFSVGHPGNNAATIAEYWAARTRELLDIEATHPDLCLRLRYEDLAADRDGQTGKVFAALGLDPDERRVLRVPDQPATDGPARFTPPVTTSQIPPMLMPTIRDLLTTLGYDPWPEQ